MTDNGYRILEKTQLCSTISKHVIHAPRIAKKAEAGQFVIIRSYEGGERIPITLFDWDAQTGNVTLIIQSIGKSTCFINNLKQGESIKNLAGPFGIPVDVRKYGTVVCVGGGVGIAELYPIAKALKAAGNKTISVLGARSKDLLILEKEMGEVSDEVLITTDDGSYGDKGLVTDALKKLHAKEEKMNAAPDANTAPEGARHGRPASADLSGTGSPSPEAEGGAAALDAVFVIGPLIMMKFVAGLTRPWAVPTYASLNPIMLDGTGMCGGCRVEIGGKSKFACVDGPMFDAHQTNFDQLMSRTAAYKDQEKKSLEMFLKKHPCKLDSH